MKYFFAMAMTLMMSSNIWSQTAVGTWKTVDDEEGTVKSHVEIYEKDGKLHGKVIKLIDPEGTTCIKCKGDKKDQPIVGMEIMWGLKPDGDHKWKGGKIMDPKNGKEYKCKLELKDDNTLDVRGFIGFSLIGRTQTWYRLEE